MEDPLSTKGSVIRLPHGKLYINRSKAPEIYYDSHHNAVLVRPGESRFSEILGDASISKYFLSPELWNAHKAAEEIFQQKGKMKVMLDASKVDKWGDLLMLTIVPKAYKEAYGENAEVHMAVPHGFEPLFENATQYIDALTNDPLSESVDVYVDLNNVELKWQEKSVERDSPNLYWHRTYLFLRSLGLFLVNRKPVYVVSEREKDWAKSQIKGLRRPIIGIQKDASCKSKTYPHAAKLAKALQKLYSVVVLDPKNKKGEYLYSIREGAALLNECDVVITPDSSMFHFAGALNKRVVGLFGNTEGKIFGEEYDKAIVVQGTCPSMSKACWWTLPCLPGQSYQEKNDVDYTACLSGISTKEILCAVKRHLAEPKKVFLCMLTWDNLPWTEKAVASIRSFHDCTLFVADNESTDGTIEWLRKNKILHVVKKTSVAGAQNLGIDAFHGMGGFDYLVFLNNDIVLHWDTINQLVKCAQEEKEFWGISAVETQHTPPWEIDAIKPNSHYKEIISDIPPSAYSCTLFTKECINKVGKFDEAFTPRYIEDNDYTLRIRLEGKKFVRFHSSVFYHVLGGVVKTKVEEKNKFNEFWTRNINYYIQKWGIHPHAPQDLMRVKTNLSDAALKARTDGTFRSLIERAKEPIVVIKRNMGGMGDHVFLSVLAEAIKSKKTDAVVYYVVPKAFWPAYEGNPFIDRVLERDTDEEGHLVLDCTDIDYRMEGYEMMQHGRILTPRNELYLNFAGFLGESIKPKYYVSEQELNWASKEWPVTGAVRVAVVINASNKLKTWPQFNALVLELQKRKFDVKVVDEPSGNGFKYTFRQGAALINAANVVISPDTGYSNVAGALKKPVITLFGYRNGDVFKKMFPSMIPINGKCEFELEKGCDYNVRCIEGSDHRAKENIKTPRCMQSITIEQIMRVTEKLWPS